MRPCSYPNCNCCLENCNPGVGYCCYDCREKPSNWESKLEEDRAKIEFQNWLSRIL